MHCKLTHVLTAVGFTDPEGVDMYVEVGRTKQGLTTWRSTRGSSKNEAANLVIERSLHTTGRMNEITALGELQYGHTAPCWFNLLSQGTYACMHA